MLSFRRHSDEQVIRRVLSGRRDDFAILVQRYLPVVHALGCAQMGNVTDAEDVAQEAFLKAYQQLGDLREPSKFGAWLLSIARNACRNYKRTRARAAKRDRAVAPPIDAQMPDPGRAEIRSLLRQRINELDEEPREILLLRYYAGKRVKEIASLLDISPDAAKKRLQRARQALSRSMLRELEPALESERSPNERVSSIMGIVAGVPITWQPGAAAVTGAGATAASAVALKTAGAALVVAAAGAGIWIVTSPEEDSQALPAPAQAGLTSEDTAASAEAETEEGEGAVRARADDGTNAGTASGTVSRNGAPTSKEHDGDQGTLTRRRVVDENGNAVPGALVRAYGPAEGRHQRERKRRAGPVLFEDETDDEGIVEGVIPPDAPPLLIEASKGDLLGLAEIGNNSEPRQHEIRLHATDVISGQVVDADERPVSGARIRPRGDFRMEGHHLWEREAWADSDEHRRFTVGPLPEGSWGLTASASGYADSKSERVLTGTQSARLVLSRGVTISGIVADPETDEPIPGVEVDVRPHPSGAPRTKTNPQGRFRVAHVTPGPVSVEVKDSVFVPIEEAARFTVSEGEACPEIRIPVARGAVITGRIYDAQTGEAPAHARVQASRQRESFGTQYFNATADEDGHFRLSGLPAGDYLVNAQPLTREYAHPSDKDAQPVSVALGDEVTDFDFPLVKGVKISGTVVDEAGQPVERARVHYVIGNRLFSSCECREDGTFEFALNQGDTFSFAASKADKASRVLGPMTAEGAIGDVTLVLSKAASVSGKVVNSKGQPIADAEVALSSASGVPLLADWRVRLPASGEFRFAPLLAGTYHVSFRQDFIHQSEEVAVNEGQELRDVVLTVEGIGDLTISGRVTDRAGQPIVGADVSVNSSSPRASSIHKGVKTDRQGAYAVAGLVQGEYRIHADHSDYAQAHLDDVQAGSEHVDFMLDEYAGVEGRVLDARSGAPLQEFEVAQSWGWHEDGAPSVSGYQKFRNSEGKFQLPRVTPSRKRSPAIVARAPGLAPGHQVVEVHPGRTTTGVEIRLEPAALIEGTVVSAQGNPIPGALIFINEVPWPLREPFVRRENASATSATDGRFVIDMTPENAAMLFAFHPDFALGQHPIQPGVSQEIAFVLDTPGIIEGQVRIGGRPAPKQHIAFSCRHTGMPYKHVNGSADTDESGHYRLEVPVSTEVNLSVSLHRLLSEPGDLPARRASIGNLSRRVFVEAGHTTVANFDAPSGTAVIEGRITLLGQPVYGGVLVEAQGDDGRLLLGGNPTPEGHYRIENVPAGTVTLIAIAAVERERSRYTKRLPFEVRSGATHHQDFDLGGTCALTGTVSGAGEEVHLLLVPGKIDITLELLRHTDWLQFEPAYRVTLAQPDNFRVDGIESGTYTVVAIGERSHAYTAAILEISEGAQASVEFALE